MGSEFMPTDNKSNIKTLVIGLTLTTTSGYWLLSRYSQIPEKPDWIDIAAFIAFLIGAALLIVATPGEEINYDERSPF